MYCKGSYDKHPIDRTAVITNAKTYACLKFHDNFFFYLNTCTTTDDIISIIMEG